MLKVPASSTQAMSMPSCGTSGWARAENSSRNRCGSKFPSRDRAKAARQARRSSSIRRHCKRSTVADDSESAGARCSSQRAIVGGHDQVAPGLLAPQERRRKMDRVEGAQLGREGLSGPRENGRGDLDELDAFEEPEHGLASPRELPIPETGPEAQPVECAKALGLGERARHARADSPPFLQRAGLT